MVSISNIQYYKNKTGEKHIGIFDLLKKKSIKDGGKNE